MKQLFTFKKNGLVSKISFAIVFTFLSISAQAQKEIETAKRYLIANAAKEKLGASDIDQMIVSSAYLSPTTGWHHVYFNQTYQSIEVYNGMMNLLVKGDKVEYTANNFVADIALKTNNKVENLNLNPVQALQKAAAKVNLTSGALDQIRELKTTQLLNGLVTQGTYADNNLSNENIEVKLYWLFDDAKTEKETEPKMALTWNVRFMTKDHQNSWNIHVDAFSGEILRQTDDVIHCNFGAPHQHTDPNVCAMGMLPQSGQASPLAANSYNVFDYPLESPNHGSRSVVINPYTKFVPTGTGPGATNGWHNDGTTNYTNTRGNNVWAQEDANNNNGTGASPSSATLEFDYPYTQAVNTAAGNLNAAITNLFYWNNVLHDVLWKYGFDEPSGNFQESNLGRGGAGSDFVYADAQDGGGTNNANFATPADGGNPRMQMYLWSNAGGYQPDGDFDNGIIAHEYGHGWSTRLTGGPANSSCLNNAEQGGEGWSDYAALMLTTNWASLTPTVASANIPRGIGTYAIGQATSGAGIRPYRYSYDMANVNGPVTYAKVGDAANFSEPHGIGSIWATMLWDMTWEIIFQDNQIVNDIYNTPANITDMRGNVAALKLVNEGLRLQACSPSLVASRDAILAADQSLFGGRYRCAIGRAFARRGLGAYASTGSSSNDRIVTEDFTPFPSSSSLLLSSSKNPSPVCSNSGFSYTATAASGTTNYSWTRPTVAGISNSAGSGNSAGVNETLINTANNPITVKYFFTLSEDACGVAQPVSVVVNPSPVPTVATYSICQNASVPDGEGLAAPPALSNSVNGTLTANSPAYRRGTGNNTTVYTAATSAGSNVYYQAFTFTAPNNGNVTFEITEAALTGTYPYDTYLTLYQTSFNAANPATNFLRGDDDSGPLLYSSKLTHSLVQGTTYVIVVTTYTNTRTGTFKLQSSEPVFPGTNNWYLNSSGGSPLATGNIFNPVGVAGSGIPNTATAGTSTFYLANSAFSSCRVPVSFSINAFVGGSLAGSAAFCGGSNSTQFILSGHVGTILKWQSASDAVFSTPADIANTNTTLNVSNVTQTTYYRAVIQSGNCTSYSTTGSVVVDPATVGGSITGSATICAGINSTLLTLANHVGAIIKWQSSDNVNFTGATDIANVTNTLTATNLNQTTYYRVVVKSGTCSQLNSATATLTVDPATVGGSITGSTTVCAGINSTLLTLINNVGNVQKWQSADNINFTGATDIANATNTLTATNLNQTTYYRAVVKSGTCSQLNSTNATVTVDPATVGGSITGSATVCTGTNSTLLTLSGHVGSVQKWQSADNINFTGATDIVNTTNTLTATNLSQTTYYRAVVKSGTCSQLTSTNATVTVDPATVGGSITGSATVCAGINSTLLTLSGHVGSVQKWQSSDNINFTGATDIANVTNTLTATNLTQATYYRAVVKSGTCSQLNSATATLTVDPATVGGSITGNATVCAGINATLLTLSGHVGSVQKWQSADNINFTGATDIANVTNILTATNLSQTTYYRAVVKSGTCSQLNSATATLTADPATVGGSITGSATVCAGINSTLLTLANHVGAIIKWQSSDNINFTGAIDIANTTNTLTASNLTQTTYYRAVVKSGTCSQLNSATATLTIDPATVGGSITGSATVCAGINATLLTLSGHVGSVQKWQSADNINFTGATDIANVTNILTATNLSQTTYYRAVVKSGTCSQLNSATATLTIDPATVGGSIIGSATVCAGINSTLLTLINNVGNVQKWQSADNINFTGATDIANVTNTLTATNLTQTTYYRAVVKSGTCSQLNSATATLTIDPATVGGSIIGSATVCAGINSTLLTLINNVGNVQKWQSADNINFTGATDIANVTNTLTASNLTQTTYYRAVVKSGTCSQLNSATATLTIDPATVGGSITGSATVCAGINSTLLTLSGHVGSVQKWQSANNVNFTGAIDISNATNTLTASNLTQTTYYRAVVKSGTCSQLNSATATLTVDPATVGGSITGSTTVCAGTNSTLLTLANHVGAIIKWQSASDAAFSAPVDIASVTNTLTATNLTQTTYYRAVVKSGTCSQLNSATATLTIDPATVGGSITGSATVCAGINATLLTLSGHVGSVQKWQSASDAAFSSPVDVTNTTNTLTATNLTQTTYYRAVVKSGTCSQLNSGNATMVVNSLPTAGISGTIALCQNSVSPNITFTGASGTAPYTFTYKINNGNNQTLNTAGMNVSATAAQTTTAAGTFTYTLVNISDANGCSQNQNGNATITINALPVVSAPASSFCVGNTITLSPASGGTWLSNDPTGATVTNAGLVTGVSAGAVTFTFTAAGCSATTTSVTVKPTPTSSLTADKVDICPNTQVILDAHCSLPNATVNWNPGAATVSPNTSTTYRASCTLEGCTSNESSVNVRTHAILADLKELSSGSEPNTIVQTVKDNLSPTNLINAPVFPRLWTIIATGCEASESAVFNVSGPINFNTVDNALPYAMFDNSGENYFSISHPNYGNGGSFPNGTYTLRVDLRSADGVGGPFPKNRVAVGNLLATRTLQFTVGNVQSSMSRQSGSGDEQWDAGKSSQQFTQVMPNPVSNTLHLKVSEAKSQKVNVSLLDAAGRVILKRTFVPETNQHQEEFEVSQLVNGMYFLQVKTADKQTTLKVIKIE